MFEEEKVKPLKGFELYNDDGTLELKIFQFKRQLAIIMAPIYNQKVTNEGLEGYKLKHLIIEAFDLIDSDAVCGNIQDLEELVTSYIKDTEGFYIFEEEKVKPLKGFELYSDDGTLDIKMFQFKRQLAIIMAPIYNQKVTNEGLDGYKLKHLMIEAFELIENDAVCGNIEDLEELVTSLNNFKHNDELWEDDTF
jgi:hypothetical protein